MTQINIFLLLIGGHVMSLGLFSNAMKERGVFSALTALVVGVVLGPYLANLLQPSDWGDHKALIEQAMRVTVGLSIVGIVLRLPRRYSVQNRRSIAIMLLGGMSLMWITTSVLVHLILDLSPWMSLLIGAIVTPTAPVVAEGIVTGGLADRADAGDARRGETAGERRHPGRVRRRNGVCARAQPGGLAAQQQGREHDRELEAKAG